jgi:hypothetical protein
MVSKDLGDLDNRFNEFQGYTNEKLKKIGKDSTNLKILNEYKKKIN